MIRIFSAFFILTLLFSPFFSIANDGFKSNPEDELLLAIGLRKSDNVIVNMQTMNGFNNRLELPSKGVKLYTDQNNQYVKSILFTNEGYEINGQKYEKYLGNLPLGFSFDSTLEGLIKIFNKPIDTNLFIYGFMVKGYKVTVEFQNRTKNARIECVTYTKAISKASSLDKPSDFSKGTEKIKLPETNSPLRNAILKIFEAAIDPNWNSIIRENSPVQNFWNYKYTWNTTLQFPQQKYNLVYAFPFPNSQRDFVVVLEEGKGDSRNIVDTYQRTKNELQQEFPASEGWEINEEKNPEDPKGPYDFKLKNKKVGTVILDYSKAPSASSVLYFRFIFLYE